MHQNNNGGKILRKAIHTVKTIQLTSEKIIKNIQKEFSDIYPFLKVEFFRKGYSKKKFFQQKQNLLGELSLGTASGRNKNGMLEIISSMTGKELEKKCDEEFGVYIKVYRKSGNLWLEITITDDWTMKQQNDYGSEILFTS